MGTRLLRSRDVSVLVNPAGVLATLGSGNWGPDTGNAFREYCSLEHRMRMRSTGFLTGIKVAGPTTLTAQAFYLRVWRLIENNRYRLVGASDDLIGLITANAVSTVTLPTPIAVQEGDFVGYRIDGVNTTAWHAVTVTGPESRYTNATTPAAVDFLWTIQNQATNTTSLTDTLSFNLETTLTTVVNHGEGGDNSTTVLARFQTDVVDLMPRYCIFALGVNDLGAMTVAQSVANFTAMYDLLVANDILGITTLVFPYTGGSNATLQKRDQLNAALVTLSAGYTGFRTVDCGTLLGQFRAGGDAGNLWDLQAAYNSGDDVHLTSLGYAVAADAIAAAIIA